MVPWESKKQQACPTNQCEAVLQNTEAGQNVLKSPNLNQNVVRISHRGLGDRNQQPVSLTPSNFAVGQPQQVGFDPLLAFRQSTGGAYHALCDAIGIDRIDPQQSMPSATSGNLRVRSNATTWSNGVTARVTRCPGLPGTVPEWNGMSASRPGPFRDNGTSRNEFFWN